MRSVSLFIYWLVSKAGLQDRRHETSPLLEYRLSRAVAAWYQFWHQLAQTSRASAKMHPFQFPIPNSWQPLRCASYPYCY